MAQEMRKLAHLILPPERPWLVCSCALRGMVIKLGVLKKAGRWSPLSAPVEKDCQEMKDRNEVLLFCCLVSLWCLLLENHEGSQLEQD
jgi:hypothetical protein